MHVPPRFDFPPRETSALFEFFQDLIRTQGDIATYRNPYGEVSFFNHPDQAQIILQGPNFIRSSLLTATLGNGLLSSEGEIWRSERHLIQPVFRDQHLRGFASTVSAATLAMLERWEGVLQDGTAFDIGNELRRLTLSVIVKFLFSLDVGDEAEEWRRAFETIMDDLGALSMTLFNLPVQFSPTRRARYQAAVEILDRQIYRMITDRRALETRPPDLLTLLISARDNRGQPLDERQIRDEIITMLIAGHETTAIALAWACFLIGSHADVEQRLRAEVDQTLKGRVPGVEDLPRLPYARMIFDESMRLYPPVFFSTRMAVADEQVAGRLVRARTVVLLSAWTTHRHPAFWADPDRFDPDRFGAERSRDRHRFAFFPFSGGRHQCIGQSFATLEGVLVLALLVQRCRVSLVPGQRVEPMPLLTLRQKHGLMVTAERRQAGAREPA